MANYKTPQIVNRENSANAQQMNNPQYGGMSNVYFVAAQWLVNASVLAADTVEMLRLPSSSRILSIWDKHESLGTTLTFSLGLATPVTGGVPTTPSSNFVLGSINIAGQTARTSFVLVGNWGSNGVTKTGVANFLWQLLGLATDPGGEIVFCLVPNGVTAPTASASCVMLLMVQVD